MSLKIPDLLKDKPEGVPVSELAKTAGVDQGKLARILRLLATKHVFREGRVVSDPGFVSLSEVYVQ